MPDLVFSRRAIEELREIWQLIAAKNPAAADRIVRRIDRKLSMLREFPDLGVARDEIRPGARLLIEGSYLLLYEHHVNDGVVEIVAIVDGRRDLAELF